VEQKDEPKDESPTNCILFPIPVKETRDEEAKCWVYANEEYNISGYGKTKKEAEDMFRDSVSDALVFDAPKVEPQPAPKEEEIINRNIDSLLSEFNRQGINTENWDGEEGWEKAIVDGVRHHIEELLAPKEESPKTYTESEVREIVGRTWEAAIKWEWVENRNQERVDEGSTHWVNPCPDKETFINTLFPSGR
jgi:hypothetical protein